MRILFVKLSSLGDVVHTMPAATDLKAAFPGAQVDWVVERGFAPLVGCCDAVNRVIECELRRWRKAPLSARTRKAWRAFKAELQRESYDAIIDLQGLTKSAVIARLAKCSPGGKRYALANRTEGSSYERPTRWLADVAIPIEPHVHAMQRARLLCARALGFDLPESAPRYGLGAKHARAMQGTQAVAFVHGTSRDDKCWPADHWQAVGLRLIASGYEIVLPHGSEEERMRSEAMAFALGPRASVLPRLDLAALTERLAACAGVIGVDSGLSHIAVALDLPHVQIYNFDTAWRTGPYGGSRQRSVFAKPTPSVDAVWDAWREVAGA
jgi:heptosyltransferase I